MGMDQELAALYGTTAGASSEDREKVAEAHLFAKLASDNGVNLNELSDEQVAQLYNATFNKVAEDEKCDTCEKAKADCTCPTADEKKAYAKVAAAQEEFGRQKEWQEKVAECDKLGRVMAHAYVQELGLIEKAAGDMPPQFAANAEKKQEEEGEGEDEEKKKEEEEKKQEKAATAIDELAANHAVFLAKQAGLDVDTAARRVGAVLTLGGPGDSEKTASARSLDEAVHVRALEFLVAAGYPVNW